MLNSRIHHMTILVTERGAEAERRKNSENPPNEGEESGMLSREEIEIRLLEAEWKLVDAEAIQNYALCSKLQREMKELEVGQWYAGVEHEFLK